MHPRLTFRLHSPQTVHACLDGVRVGSLHRGKSPRVAWMYERHAETPGPEWLLLRVFDAAAELHGRYATAENVAALNE